ncbi:hypothetical protein BU16DRAFT_531554 [Lophium mytilinum]|uniref:F-box domain-containing protein n=1 Tax=Lophium mytilinum TaxID=390894 RepID=A0A6A6QBZ5_9PEZI|nr:hypothetical protein BU16DRAFT_531554 [Lophium mytilinum]
MGNREGDHVLHAKIVLLHLVHPSSLCTSEEISSKSRHSGLLASLRTFHSFARVVLCLGRQPVARRSSHALAKLKPSAFSVRVSASSTTHSTWNHNHEKTTSPRPGPGRDASMIFRPLQIVWWAIVDGLLALHLAFPVLSYYDGHDRPTKARDAVLNSPELLDLILHQLGVPHVLKYKRICRAWKEAIESSPAIQHDLWKRPIDRDTATEFTTHDLLDLVYGGCRVCGISANHKAPSADNLNPILAPDLLVKRESWLGRLVQRWHLWRRLNQGCWSVQDDGSLLFSFIAPFPLPLLTGDLDLTTATWRDTLVSLPRVTKVTIRGRRIQIRHPAMPFMPRWKTQAVLENPNGLRMGELMDVMREMDEFMTLRGWVCEWRFVPTGFVLLGALLLLSLLWLSFWAWIFCNVTRWALPFIWVHALVPSVTMSWSYLQETLAMSFMSYFLTSIMWLCAMCYSRVRMAWLQRTSKATLTWS